MKRNLIYFICPFEHNNEWKRNIKKLQFYIDVFNNKRIITIAQGNGLVDADIVIKECGFKADFRIAKNDLILNETAHFIGLLSSVYSKNDDEITFYAHAKGVSYPSNHEDMKSIKIWTDCSYNYCLGDIYRIEHILNKYSCCGCFKKHGEHHLPMPVDWHFSGTFFWFKNNVLFRNDNWQSIDKNRYGVEGYLGSNINSSEAYCLFGDNPQHSNLYRYAKYDWMKLYDNKTDSIVRNFCNNNFSEDYINRVKDLLRAAITDEEKDLIRRKEGITKMEAEKIFTDFF